MSASDAGQAFIVQTLLDDPDVAAIVETRVWDDVPNRPDWPYCAMGPHYHNRADADDLRKREHYFQVDCWTAQRGRRDQVNRLTDAVEAALDGALGDLGGTYALASCDVVLVRVMDDRDGKKHGVVQVKLIIEGG